ncbi:MAG: phytoene desaturase [Spirochaetales bacterium]|nr:phytoene desaturase [Spirochaetales bacterium]
MAKKTVIIGAGYTGLAAASMLAARGRDVTVVEKNNDPGGRGRGWNTKGFMFDMGPSWYLMPEVFESFFAKLGKKREDYYKLSRLPTYYQVFFGDGTRVQITDNLEQTRQVFESLEPGGAAKLDRYLAAAKYKYDTAIGEFLYRDYGSVFDFFNKKLVVEGLKLDVFTSLDKFVQREFSDVRARQLLEYAMVFLGSSPSNAPALYSLMSHVDLNLGVWFPEGGMVSIVLGMEKLARELGVRIEYNAPVVKILTKNGKAIGVETPKGRFDADEVLVTADYAHAELDLLSEPDRSYSRRYWEKATVAPGMLLAYLGTKKKVPGLEHHNLYFSANWNRHFDTIFKKPSWPADPCFYASVISKTESTVAPADGENIFLLVPTAPGLDDTDEAREALFDVAAGKLESLIGASIRDDLVVKRLFSHRDFSQDYNAWQGTALGLSHTLAQTAVLRPARRSKKVAGLWYAGQYTHPGVGVPMTLIAAELAVGAITVGD